MNNNIIDETESVCPACLKTIPAVIYGKLRDGQNQVYLSKSCPEHGDFDVYLWHDIEHYQWFTGFTFPPAPRLPQTSVNRGCPKDCGLCPNHIDRITLAEIEVTQRCNLACPVCFMSAAEGMSDPSLATIDEMLATIQRYDGGYAGLQITGGEPTLRADLPDIIRHARQAGFDTIELNSNGIVAASDPSYLRSLKEAGLSNIYLQFDGFTPEINRTLRGADVSGMKQKAIENCREEGIIVILATTVVEGVNDDQLGALIDFAMSNRDVIGGLSVQPAFFSGRFDVPAQKHLSLADVALLIEKQTAGRITLRDFWPNSAAHPLCGCATHIVGDRDTYRPITRSLKESDYLANYDGESPQGSSLVDMAAAAGIEPNGLTILLMSYMDAWTLDLKRLRECNLAVTVPDGRTIPFCAYHLTDASGKRLYAPAGKKRETCQCASY